MNDHACTCGTPGHTLDTSLTLNTSLLKFVDVPSVRGLNESEEGSCRGVIKEHAERGEVDPRCSSEEGDPELIIHVPFTEAVNLKSLSITGLGASSPSSVRLWVDRDDVDFEAAGELEPAQVVDLVDPSEHPDFTGTLDYDLKPTKFSNVSSLTLFFPSSFSPDRTTITYLGFNGVATGARRGVVDCVYESRPVPADHAKVAGESSSAASL